MPARPPTKASANAKARIFTALKEDYQVLKANWGGYAGYDRFFAEPLNNAHLASVATYNDFLPGFRALLLKEKAFPQFYVAVRNMSNLPSVERHGRLHELARTMAQASETATAAAAREPGAVN